MNEMIFYTLLRKISSGSLLVASILAGIITALARLHNYFVEVNHFERLRLSIAEAPFVFVSDA